MNCKKIDIITVAKVASSSFLYSLQHKYTVNHHHSIEKLNNVIQNHTDTLIITGIRNPLERNLSYFFQTYFSRDNIKVETVQNKFKGEYCYAFDQDELFSLSTEEVIKSFFNLKYHFTFNDWFEDFFNIIPLSSFNKEKGYNLYNLPNNNVLLLYTFEKLKDNEKDICKMFDISCLLKTNHHKTRSYNLIYENVKKQIKFTQEYKNKLLNTHIMNFFYTQEDIEKFNQIF